MVTESAVAHVHPAAIRPEERVRINSGGLWLFIVGESMIFVTLLSVRFLLAGVSRAPELNQALAAAMSAVLFASSLPAHLASRAAERHDQGALCRYLLTTALMGILFLAGMAYEWSRIGISPASRYGEVFFTTTGFHGVHLLVGIFVMFSTWLRARRGQFTPENRWGVTAAERYWHFVDVVWAFIYPTLYLV